MLPVGEKQIREYLVGILEDPRVKLLLQFIEDDNKNTVEEQCEIALIESPPLHEGNRAQDMARRFAGCGLADAKVDEFDNVIAFLHGSGSQGTVLIEAHLDTVFPFGTVNSIRNEEGRILAPGICDNARGLASLLSIIKAINKAKITLLNDVVFAGTSGEEGIGDLKGMRGIFASSKKGFDYSISLDGHGIGDFVFDATGSRRYIVHIETAGGHSWTNFGRPSAIHAIGRAISGIVEINVPNEPKTTFNVGLIEGGTSVNAIAQAAEMTVDMRSESPKELDELEKALIGVVEKACEQEIAHSTDKLAVNASFKKVGDRPAGKQADGSPIMLAASISSELLGIKFERSKASSTNANIPISLGIPCLCMGVGGDGGGIHTLQEWFIPSDGWKAIQQAALLLIACSGLA